MVARWGDNLPHIGVFGKSPSARSCARGTYLASPHFINYNNGLRYSRKSLTKFLGQTLH